MRDFSPRVSSPRNLPTDESIALDTTRTQSRFGLLYDESDSIGYMCYCSSSQAARRCLCMLCIHHEAHPRALSALASRRIFPYTRQSEAVST